MTTVITAYCPTVGGEVIKQSPRVNFAHFIFGRHGSRERAVIVYCGWFQHGRRTEIEEMLNGRVTMSRRDRLAILTSSHPS